VGVMKGVIAGINPEARIVDISHHIDPQDIVHGAFILAAAIPLFPCRNRSVAVVDPGVGKPPYPGGRMRRQRFVAPDNGLLERVLAHQPFTAAVQVRIRATFWNG
jgi:S-adenosylmethionine hydrolase